MPTFFMSDEIKRRILPIRTARALLQSAIHP